MGQNLTFWTFWGCTLVLVDKTAKLATSSEMAVQKKKKKKQFKRLQSLSGKHPQTSQWQVEVAFTHMG
jgi:hypothetical protein